MQVKHYSLEQIAALPYPPESWHSRPAPTEESAREKMEEIFKDGVLLSKPTILLVNNVEYVGDGHRRFAALKLAIAENDPRLAAIGLADGIDLQVHGTDEGKALLLQLSGNLSVKPQTNAEYAKALCKALVLNPSLTREELARQAGMSINKLNDVLRLTTLPEKAQELNNAGVIELTKAIALAKVPKALINDDLLEKAATQDVNTFLTSVQTAVEEFRKERQEAKKLEGPKGPKVFVAVPKLLKADQLKDMLTSAQSMFDVDQSESNRIRLEVLKEIFSLDEVTVAKAKEAFDAEEKKKEEDRLKRAADREAKKLAEFKEAQKAFA